MINRIKNESWEMYFDWYVFVKKVKQVIKSQKCPAPRHGSQLGFELPVSNLCETPLGEIIVFGKDPLRVE